MEVTPSDDLSCAGIELVDVVLSCSDVDMLNAVGAGIHERMGVELLGPNAIEISRECSLEDLAEAITANDCWIEVVVCLIPTS